MYIIELIDKAITSANLKSDYRLAKVLDVPNGWITDYRKGTRHPGTAECVKLAALVDEEEMDVIARVEYETTKNAKKREFWKHYIESRSITACLAMTALAAAIVVAPEPADASVLHLPNYDANNAFLIHQKYTLCARKGPAELRLVFTALLKKWLEFLAPKLKKTGARLVLVR